MAMTSHWVRVSRAVGLVEAEDMGKWFGDWRKGLLEVIHMES